MSGDALAPHLTLVRLRAEAALVARLNAGFGFGADTPSRMYLRDAAARDRMSRDALQPRDTHLEQAEEIADALEDAEAAVELYDSPLTLLAERFALSPGEAELLTVAVAYQLDADVRDLCDALAGRRRGSLRADIALELCPAIDGVPALLYALHLGGRLRAELLLEVGDEDREPIAAASIGVRRRVLDWLLGDERLSPDVHGLITFVDPRRDTTVFLSPEAIERIDQVATRLRAFDPASGEPVPMVLIQGPQGSGKREVARRLAAALNLPLATLPIPSLIEACQRGDRSAPRRALGEARMGGALPYAAGIQALGEEAATEVAAHVRGPIEYHRGPVLVSTRERGVPSVPFTRPFHLVQLERPDVDTRRAAWAAALSMLGPEADTGLDTAQALAARYVIGPGMIADVVREARDFARAAGSGVRLTGIEDAVGRRLTLKLGSFGTVITRRASFEQMVLPEDVLDTLQDMIAMVRQRATILEEWGYARHLGISRGVSALFSGAPGTGKTMAASVISSELGMELIRIDLSAVVSKWVGETEKHLAKIFDEAQNANAMLVFDEADSLFGKRTEVKSAQDRYANLEVNYVLQRMETFDGICVLTSNLEASIDPAFLRRLNFRLRFPEPEADERMELWRRLLPPEVSPEVNDGNAAILDRLANTFEMTGGHIKNAIVRAAVIAARDGRRLEVRDLVAGAHVEYLELGKVMPSF
jgi:AAA+ superfamily predicted ATPase